MHNFLLGLDPVAVKLCYNKRFKVPGNRSSQAITVICPAFGLPGPSAQQEEGLCKEGPSLTTASQGITPLQRRFVNNLKDFRREIASYGSYKNEGVASSIDPPGPSGRLVGLHWI